MIRTTASSPIARVTRATVRRDGTDPAGFDHDATRYRLTGLHTRVECAECHPPRSGGSAGASVVELQIHRPRLRTVHETATWMSTTAAWAPPARRVTSRRAGTGWERTRCAAASITTGAFLLEGRTPIPSAPPATADCPTCDGRRPHRIPRGTERKAYPSPIADGCLCPATWTEHDGEFVASAAGGSCDRCHTQTEWYPARYDFRRHNEETAFALEGAHVATPCVAVSTSEPADAGCESEPYVSASASVMPAPTATRRTIRTPASSTAGPATRVTETGRSESPRSITSGRTTNSMGRTAASHACRSVTRASRLPAEAR